MEIYRYYPTLLIILLPQHYLPRPLHVHPFVLISDGDFSFGDAVDTKWCLNAMQDTNAVSIAHVDSTSSMLTTFGSVGEGFIGPR